MAQREVVAIIDWPALWTELDRIRETTSMSQEQLWKRSTPDDEVSKQTFYNYLSGKTSPPMALGIPLYHRAAEIVNRQLQKEGQPPGVPFLTLLKPEPTVRGEESVPNHA